MEARDGRERLGVAYALVAAVEGQQPEAEALDLADEVHELPVPHVQEALLRQDFVRHHENAATSSSLSVSGSTASTRVGDDDDDDDLATADSTFVHGAKVPSSCCNSRSPRRSHEVGRAGSRRAMSVLKRIFRVRAGRSPWRRPRAVDTGHQGRRIAVAASPDMSRTRSCEGGVEMKHLTARLVRKFF